MTDASLIDIGQNALMLAIQISAPVLGLAMIVGLVVSVFQAVTQIQEMSLTFIPKILAISIGVAVFGRWMLAQLVSFTNTIFQSIPALLR